MHIRTPLAPLSFVFGVVFLGCCYWARPSMAARGRGERAGWGTAPPQSCGGGARKLGCAPNRLRVDGLTAPNTNSSLDLGRIGRLGLHSLRRISIWDAGQSVAPVRKSLIGGWERAFPSWSP